VIVETVRPQPGERSMNTQVRARRIKQQHGS
jgi:hypothetical protein